jgi:hypothetical protein
MPSESRISPKAAGTLFFLSSDAMEKKVRLRLLTVVVCSHCI